MDSPVSLIPLLLLILILSSSSSSSATLSFDFYSATCPAVDMIVSNTVRTASSNDPSVPGKLLRLLFHDCFVDGCDASVLLEGNSTEKTDPANGSLGGFEVIDSAKRVLEVFCPGVVSCADILALAARDAVVISGGLATQIPMGRRDGLVSSVVNVRPNIVDTSFTMSEMVKIFSSKGLSLDDLVVLSGAHTIGSAHCVDSALDANYAKDLIQKCPAGANPSVTVVNDPETSTVFDNQYYRNLLGHKGLFQSDSVLLEDQRTAQLVRDLAADEDAFYERWSESFLKLTTVGVKTGEEQGEIRASCSLVNNNGGLRNK
ncbi:Peroxidase 46 [Linum perenne]